MTSPEPSPLISGKNDPTTLWQSRLDDLAQQLAARDKENIHLNGQLLKYKEENEDYKRQVVELQQNLATALQQVSSVVPSKAAADTPTAMKEIRDLEEENARLHTSYAEIRDEVEEIRKELTICHSEIKEKAVQHENIMVELTRSRAEATSYQNQLRAQTDQSDQRGMSDAVHYKERAKLSADISAYKRKVEQLEKEKMDLEAALEDITLDKEQLQEEKDAIEERYEDLKLDAETAQMEVEELRIELEDAKATAGRVLGVADTLTAAAMASAGSPSKANVNNNESGDNLEMIQTLQTQNARLREALIRLREQSSLEKMEMTRQLRSVEKAAETNTAIQNRVEELTDINQNLNEQVNDLKDMVEQGAAFESMVEDLSDRVLGLEEQNVALNTIIRELEEAAELTAEMEEVQADELKALSRDLEGRDTMIRNLEEAIKM
jgi:dynactin 1